MKKQFGSPNKAAAAKPTLESLAAQVQQLQQGYGQMANHLNTIAEDNRLKTKYIAMVEEKLQISENAREQMLATLYKVIKHANGGEVRIKRDVYDLPEEFAGIDRKMDVTTNEVIFKSVDGGKPVDVVMTEGEPDTSEQTDKAAE